MPQEELYDSIKVCAHGSDCSVLYDFVGMRHAMCNSCWHEEEHVRTSKDAVSIFRKWHLSAVNAACLHCDTDVTAQKNCTRCFQETG